MLATTRHPLRYESESSGQPLPSPLLSSLSLSLNLSPLGDLEILFVCLTRRPRSPLSREEQATISIELRKGVNKGRRERFLKVCCLLSFLRRARREGAIWRLWHSGEILETLCKKTLSLAECLPRESPRRALRIAFEEGRNFPINARHSANYKTLATLIPYACAPYRFEESHTGES